MPEQKDYGDSGSDTTLVPGTLIAYRHFVVIPPSPMGVEDAPILAPTNITSGFYADVRDVYEARCIKPFNRRPYHDSPDVDCTCGFYAHYDPTTDFYEGWGWTDSTEGARGGLLSRPSFGIVRAVVELSGKHVMGRLGVRAQKQKVKALAVDWKKYLRRQSPRPRFTGDPNDIYYWVEDVANAIGTYRPASPTNSVRERYEGYAAQLAERHGAEYFTDVDEMSKAYPQPDLSALGITPAEPKPTTPHSDAVQQLAQQILAALDLDASTTLVYDDTTPLATSRRKPKAKGQKATYVIVDETYVIVDEMSPFQRAMEAKRNRPAPPGVGIDRRKRKL